jgi:hypothetical protein
VKYKNFYRNIRPYPLHWYCRVTFRFTPQRYLRTPYNLNTIRLLTSPERAVLYCDVPCHIEHIQRFWIGPELLMAWESQRDLGNAAFLCTDITDRNPYLPPLTKPSSLLNLLPLSQNILFHISTCAVIHNIIYRAQVQNWPTLAGVFSQNLFFILLLFM